ncbi:hypothetical protein [Plantactinospora sp. KLBMP9567]|nr:hypothetical protein [Plantactinospora sp. KLBMP9567]MDW5329111.1 hypothetical protein [Plantactinospora sp. KLBMP9567]MDW5329985.1 hypothetical protein [Plantactinospora sp. KLBMP9567]
MSGRGTTRAGPGRAHDDSGVPEHRWPAYPARSASVGDVRADLAFG